MKTNKGIFAIFMLVFLNFNILSDKYQEVSQQVIGTVLRKTQEIVPMPLLLYEILFQAEVIQL